MQRMLFGGKLFGEVAGIAEEGVGGVEGVPGGVVFFVYDGVDSGGGGSGDAGGRGWRQRGRVLGGEAGPREEVPQGDACGPGGLEGRNGAGGGRAWDRLGCSRFPLAPWRKGVLFLYFTLRDGEEERAVCVQRRAGM